jgi:hypothetical protein
MHRFGELRITRQNIAAACGSAGQIALPVESGGVMEKFLRLSLAMQHLVLFFVFIRCRQKEAASSKAMPLLLAA